MALHFNPKLWASMRPFGAGLQRPNNFAEVFRALWENRRRPRYAWRILNEGVCDGCALGTTGMKDWTLDGPHLCNVRLRLLSLNTMGPMDPAALGDVAALRGRSSAELRALGRLPHPMVRRAGEAGFSRTSWEEALDLIAARIRDTTPDRTAAFLTSRGMPNESYYVAQKAMRAIGTNNIDNAARICHSPSTYGLREALGVGASTCSYTDWIGSDLIVFIGANPANNQPVAMKYLYEARQQGTKVVCINPYREPGMAKYWIPSVPESALFGTTMTDRFFEVDVGGDAAFLTGALKHMVANGLQDETFVREHASGWAELAAHVASLAWPDLERAAGVHRAEMEEFGELLGAARTGVLVWSMGVTQHTAAEDAVRAIVNLGLSRGFVGREKCGLMPIRGHSGVQGGAEMGCYATALPGGDSITPERAVALSAKWGFSVPSTHGLTAPQMLDAAHDGTLDVLLSAGGNFLEVLPDPARVEAALGRVGLRVHLDIVTSTQMLVDPADTVILLPAATRYEIPGGVTETSTERRIIFSPEIPGTKVDEARGEWDVFGEIAARVRPELASSVKFATTTQVRDEIATVVPMYDGIQHLRAAGDQVQYGGERLCEGWRFGTPDKRAHFTVVSPPLVQPADGRLRLTTRRGKQFNSMVQENVDKLNGAGRDAVLMSARDARELGVADGGAVVLRSDHGELRATVRVSRMKPGNVAVHWPEGNVLIAGDARSPESGVPDYNAWVDVAAD